MACPILIFGDAFRIDLTTPRFGTEGTRGLVVGRGSAVSDQPYLDLLPLPEAGAVALVQLRIYRDPFDQWVVEDHGNNGLTSVRGAVLNGERSMPWYNNRISAGGVVFLWKCLEDEERV